MHEEGEELVQVVDEARLGKAALKELERQREEMATTRKEYEKDLLEPLKEQKLSEEERGRGRTWSAYIRF